jgi:hypothetical protein
MDPRPDLPDSPLWGPLLAAAWREGAAVYGALHGLRCLGAGAEAAGAGLRLVAGEIDPAEYAELRRRWLLPHLATLRRLLRDGPDGAAA